MIDYYALSADAPGMATRPNGSPSDRVRYVEQALRKTEAWVFAGHEQLALLLGDDAANTLRGDAQRGDGPEAIRELGLVELRRRCPHADEWLGSFLD